MAAMDVESVSTGRVEVEAEGLLGEEKASHRHGQRMVLIGLVLVGLVLVAAATGIPRSRASAKDGLEADIIDLAGFPNKPWQYDPVCKLTKVHKMADGVYCGPVMSTAGHGGRTKAWYNNGDLYFGEWKDGQRSGEGIMNYADGTIKTGLWEADQFKGETSDHPLADQHAAKKHEHPRERASHHVPRHEPREHHFGS
ncbi:unnamed protein product [Durusdinium trenchii]|uniref:MORN repeat-containing protein 5 n=2 Tax=Durusdinium trenchii TaxID=1381693 RepID=A0ABP0JU33_9DINO